MKAFIENINNQVTLTLMQGAFTHRMEIYPTAKEAREAIPTGYELAKDDYADKVTDKPTPKEKAVKNGSKAK